ncbi:MAG: hypothetical protein QXE98_05645 [Archaeoglobaceae archaeon]
MRMTKYCQLCGRKFTSNISAFEHFKREHVGKLSEESYRYLRSLGVTTEKITEFCRANGIQLDVHVIKQEKQLTLERW